jgi:hypothetical protein
MSTNNYGGNKPKDTNTTNKPQQTNQGQQKQGGQQGGFGQRTQTTPGQKQTWQPTDKTKKDK